MLTSLLPGLRELRTPLAAGYLWLINAWIVFGRQVPRRRPSHGAVALLWDLGVYVDRAVLLAAVTFAAYLIGSLLEIQPQRLWDFGGRPEWITSRLNRWRSATRLIAWFRFPALSDNAQWDLRTVAADADPDIDQLRLEKLQRGTLREVRQLATRLQTTNVELYGKYDRLLAEATFRLNIVPPLTLLLTIVILESDQAIWWRAAELLVVAACVVVLLRQVVSRVVQSNDVIMQALVVGLVDSRTVRSHVATIEAAAPTVTGLSAASAVDR